MNFSPKITLIGGRNETGKSTLIEAIHRTLFLKATATGAPIEALRSKIHLGHPTIHLQFEAKGQTYFLNKCFTGASGQVTLLSEETGEQLSGQNAEECLAGILGVKESLGSRQAGSLLATRWSHLWVMQGSAGNDLLKNEKEYYDFDSLLIQLEKTGGAAIQQSNNDQRVIKKIEEAIEENFTRRGTKKNSPYWQRQKELDNAESALEIAISRLEEYEQSSEELIEITEELNHLQNLELPKLLKQKHLVSIKAENIKKLEREINLVEKELEPIELRYNTSQKALISIRQLKGDIKKKEQEQKESFKEHNQEKALESLMTEKLKTKQEMHHKLKEDLGRINKRREVLQVLVDQARIKESISRLNTELNKIEQLTTKQKELEQQVTSYSKISRSDLQKLKELNQKIRDSRTRQNSMTTSVKIIRSNQPILLNGKKLPIGEKEQFSKTFELEIGDKIALEITPGGYETLSDVQFKYKEMKKEYSNLLSENGLQSLEFAEEHFETRFSLEQQIAALDIATKESIQSKKEELEECKLKDWDFEKQILACLKNSKELENEQLLSNNVIELTELQRKAKKAFIDTSSSLNESEQDLEKTQSTVQKFRSDLIENESNSKIINGELISSRKILKSLQEEHGEEKLLETKINSIKLQLQKSQDHLTNLKSQFNSLEKCDKSSDLSSIENRLKSLDQKKEALIASKGAARRNCETISNSDPYAAVEETKVKLENVETDFKSLQRITDSHKLLKELFNNVQSDLSSRYSEPLAKSIGKYLQPLFSKQPIAHLSFNQTTGFSGLQMKRGKEFYSFDQLSGGMREQLSAALRLSMAEVLKHEHDGCLPLVFDDAFANSDPERIPHIKQMLTKAVNQGLQVIILTCDPESYASFAEQIFRLS
ncbi:DNA double-strand break repair Rad50 ATPase [Prochlorococcus sp. SS52]|uniref:AAA family ATPase n=1 Tax=Prochlorococcus TaxID=1218 RepID=UPI0002D64AF8|nr:DNA double-strand break repair Rad50 ATPase [Prochlorococcus marinus str. LG]KGG22555.1 DNA double-strand break repair Rad50 ATPase [Prochlorococcus marinus str. SS2]KGG24398.1 DNA double-strand break repair Rad50 ATPase [Prochlorococcus marinus str. SS35]KGG34170.1 DNA double-strand break repair Rad50 ATPase [Prochlorococcus marinus str. SS51]KGG35809.1 DNA double-strand break repair Rad50 ATPase [Prochlorococcus sp. SS52]